MQPGVDRAQARLVASCTPTAESSSANGTRSALRISGIACGISRVAWSRPQPVADTGAVRRAGRRAARRGARNALGSRDATGRSSDRTGNARVTESTTTRTPSNGQAGSAMGRGQHHLRRPDAPPGRNGTLLLFHGRSHVQWIDIDVTVLSARLDIALGPTDLPGAGQECQHVAFMFGECTLDCLCHNIGKRPSGSRAGTARRPDNCGLHW